MRQSAPLTIDVKGHPDFATAGSGRNIAVSGSVEVLFVVISDHQLTGRLSAGQGSDNITSAPREMSAVRSGARAEDGVVH